MAYVQALGADSREHDDPSQLTVNQATARGLVWDPVKKTWVNPNLKPAATGQGGAGYYTPSEQQVTDPTSVYYGLTTTTKTSTDPSSQYYVPPKVSNVMGFNPLLLAIPAAGLLLVVLLSKKKGTPPTTP